MLTHLPLGGTIIEAKYMNSVGTDGPFRFSENYRLCLQQGFRGKGRGRHRLSCNEAKVGRICKELEDSHSKRVCCRNPQCSRESMIADGDEYTVEITDSPEADKIKALREEKERILKRLSEINSILGEQ